MLGILCLNTCIPRESLHGQVKGTLASAVLRINIYILFMQHKTYNARYKTEYYIVA